MEGLSASKMSESISRAFRYRKNAATAPSRVRPRPIHLDIGSGLQTSGEEAGTPKHYIAGEQLARIHSNK